MTKQEIYQVRSLKQDIQSDLTFLGATLRDYRAERGAILRAYRRDICRKAIKDIRIAQANLKLWGDLA